MVSKAAKTFSMRWRMVPLLVVEIGESGGGGGDLESSGVGHA